MPMNPITTDRTIMPSSRLPVQGHPDPEPDDPVSEMVVHPLLAIVVSASLAGAVGVLSDWTQAGWILSACLGFFHDARRRTPSLPET